MSQLLLRREFVLSSTMALALGALPVNAQSQTVLGAMINTSGRNRMHSQRIVRAYAQIVTNIDADAARRHMAESSKAIGAALDALELTPLSDGVSAATKNAWSAWTGFRSQVQATPSREELKAVNGAAETFFAAANGMTLALQDFAKQKAAKLTNDAGAQRPRVMRLAKCCLMDLGGVAMRDEVATAKAQFEAVHASLEQAPETTGAIRAQLDLVKIQFGFVATAIESKLVDRNTFARAAVSTSERIVDLMDDVVLGYSKQVRAV
jgi:Type IV pili methyl-accepting chemotaxis transducer N-term